MSGSRGNNIGLTEAPEEQFGKAMRIPDSMLEEWWTLVASRTVPEGEPMQAKLELARCIVARSHGEEAAREAEEHFTRVVRRGEAPRRCRSTRFRRAIPSICRRCSPTLSGSRRARPGG